MKRQKLYELKGKQLIIEVAGEKKIVNIENIEFDEIIGEGANGVVAKARDKKLNRDIAVKIWLPNISSGKTEVVEQQYIEEIQKIAQLNDSHIAQIYCAGSDKDIKYSMMEYVDGSDLKKGLSLLQMKSRVVYAKQILQTMIKCYKKGITHGDLHLGNIMVNSEGEIKILDFGTSLYNRGTGKSERRERDLLVDTICRIVGREKMKRYTYLGITNKSHAGENINDIRNLGCLDIAEVLLRMIELMDYMGVFNEHIKSCIYMSEEEMDKLYELISNTPYVRIQEVIKDIAREVSQEEKNRIYSELLDYMGHKFWQETDEYLIAYVQWCLIEEMNVEDIKEQGQTRQIIDMIHAKKDFVEFIEEIQQQFKTETYDFNTSPIYNAFRNIGLIIEKYVVPNIPEEIYWSYALMLKDNIKNNYDIMNKLSELKKVEAEWMIEGQKNAIYSKTPDFKERLTYDEMIQDMLNNNK